MRVAVLTVDQRGSTERTATDRVPTTLAGLTDLPDVVLLRTFERTAGDEFQGVLDDAGSLVTVVERLLREDTWNIGLGVGAVDEPLPESTRAGRGPAYLHARDAVTAAKSSHWRLRVVGDRPGARHVETVLMLWASVLGRRTKGGWEVADLADTGLRYDDIARRLDITPSAVSQRAQAAGIVEGRRARELVRDLVAELLADEDGPR